MRFHPGSQTHSPRRPAWIELALVACAAAAGGPDLRAQTFHVDASGAPGTSFTQIDTAINTVPSGSVLRVHPGTYNAFTLTNKEVSILGDDPQNVRVVLNRSITIQSTQQNQHILLSNLEFVLDPASPPGTKIQIRQTGGSIYFNYVNFLLSAGTASAPGPSDAQIVVDRCTDVHFNACYINGGAQGPSGPLAILRVNGSYVEMAHCVVQGGHGRVSGEQGSHGIHAANSDLSLNGTQVYGGAGFDAATMPGQPVDGGDGGTGILLDAGAVLTLMSSRSAVVQGGRGGSESGDPQSSAADGGDGLELLNGSSVYIHGPPIFAGRGGTGGINPFGSPGTRILADASSSVSTYPTVLGAIGALVGTPRIGSSVSLLLFTDPGSSIIAIGGFEPDYVPVTPLAFGALTIKPHPGLITPPLALPLGFYMTTFTIPPGWPLDTPLYLQFVVINPSAIFLSNSVVLVVPS